MRARTRPVAARDYWEQSRLRRYLATRVFRAVLVDRAGAASRQLRSTDGQLIGGSTRRLADPLPGRHARRRRGDRASSRAGSSTCAAAARRRSGAGLPRRTSTASCRRASSCPCRCSAASPSARRCACWTGETKAAFLARAREAVVALGADMNGMRRPRAALALRRRAGGAGRRERRRRRSWRGACTSESGASDGREPQRAHPGLVGDVRRLRHRAADRRRSARSCSSG